MASHQVLAAVAESYGFDVQGDDYVLTGYGRDAEADKVDLIAYRFTATGELDTTFGTNGRILTDLGTNGDSWYGVALSTDGKTAYLAGYSNVSADEIKSDDSFLGRLKIS